VVSSDGDVGLAVATPDGVMMPVVAKVATLDAASLVAARTDAVRRGREGRLSAHDLNSTALGSLSNLGSRGVDSFTGVVPLGQHVLLTVGRLAPRPVAVEDRIAVRPTVIATVNVDHRVMDGDQAADLLAAFDREFSGLRAWVQGDQA
jgi:pyruvate dehydrogenase E2 component (dihydrolipoamide acetyltransferase)